MGKQLANELLVKDLNLSQGQALQVILSENHVNESTCLYDVVREND